MSIQNKIKELVDERNAILANAMTIDGRKRREIDEINGKIAKLESFISVKSKTNKK